MKYFFTFINLVSNWFTLYCLTAFAWILRTNTFPFFKVGITATAILIVTILFSQTEMGSKFIRLFEPVRPLTKLEKGRFEPIVDEICQKAKIKPPKLFMIDNMNPNAYVLGDAIVFTRGFLHIATVPEIKGVVAHEVGHIVNGDSKLATMNNVVNKVGNAGVVVLLTLTLSITNNNQRIWLLPFIFIAVLLKTIRAIIFGLSYLGLMAISRSDEYRADQFAKKLGYEDGLCSYLNKIEPSQPSKKSIFRTHPPVALRIDRLQAAF